jgi:peptidoglycan/LPS O-acetylase OafA/YrhL
MASLIVAVAASLAAGFIVWGADRRRSRYGIFLLPGLGLVAGLLLWVILQLAGAGSDPDLHWLVWALPPVGAAVTAVTTALVLGPARESRDTAELERVLRL